MKFKFNKSDYEYELYLEDRDVAIFVNPDDDIYVGDVTFVHKITGETLELNTSIIQTISNYLDYRNNQELERQIKIKQAGLDHL